MLKMVLDMRPFQIIFGSLLITFLINNIKYKDWGWESNISKRLRNIDIVEHFFSHLAIFFGCVHSQILFEL